MKFINSNQIRTHINRAASRGMPFFFIINYEMTEGLFIENPMKQAEVLFRFPGAENISRATTHHHQQPELNVYPIPEEEYRSKFNVMQQGLKSGEIDVVNLTVRTPISTTIDCGEIFLRSRSPYRIYLPGKFVCFSPERFVKIENGTISSNPMKGTIDASTANAEQRILTDSKEIGEHTATVKLVTEELRSVARNVETTRFRYIDRIDVGKRTLLQVSSEIEGKLANDYNSMLGDILFSLLPAASVTGSPKAKAGEYIRLAEGEPRGYYCGIAGYSDGKTVDTAVLIRLIETEDGKMFFRSGGGLTGESVWENEYQEVLNKIYLPFV